MLKDIVEKPIPMKPYFSPEATSLLKVLLERDPEKRIGSSVDSNADEIKNHPFFASINWEDIKYQRHEPVFKPKVRGVEDVSCIDKLFTKEGLEETMVDPSAMTNLQKK